MPIGFETWQEDQGRVAQQQIDLRKQVDVYGLALMMIREGVAAPSAVARTALEKFQNKDG